MKIEESDTHRLTLCYSTFSNRVRASAFTAILLLVLLIIGFKTDFIQVDLPWGLDAGGTGLWRVVGIAAAIVLFVLPTTEDLLTKTEFTRHLIYARCFKIIFFKVPLQDINAVELIRSKGASLIRVYYGMNQTFVIESFSDDQECLATQNMLLNFLKKHDVVFEVVEENPLSEAEEIHTQDRKKTAKLMRLIDAHHEALIYVLFMACAIPLLLHWEKISPASWLGSYQLTAIVLLALIISSSICFIPNYIRHKTKPSKKAMGVAIIIFAVIFTATLIHDSYFWAEAHKQKQRQQREEEIIITPEMQNGIDAIQYLFNEEEKSTP